MESKETPVCVSEANDCLYYARNAAYAPYECRACGSLELVLSDTKNGNVECVKSCTLKQNSATDCDGHVAPCADRSVYALDAAGA